MRAPVAAILVWITAAVVLLYGLYCLAQMLRHRRDEHAAFTGAAHELAPDGQPLRRRFFLAWATFVVLMLVLWYLASGAP